MQRAATFPSRHFRKVCPVSRFNRGARRENHGREKHRILANSAACLPLITTSLAPRPAAGTKPNRRRVPSVHPERGPLRVNTATGCYYKPSSRHYGKTKRGKNKQEFRRRPRRLTPGTARRFCCTHEILRRDTNEKTSSTIIVNRRSVVAGDFLGCLADCKQARGFVDIR